MSDDGMQQPNYIPAIRPPQSGIFEVFAGGDPITELWYIFLYMILPTAIGTIMVRLIIHAYAQRSGRLQRFSTWPVSLMIATLLSAVYVFAFFSIAFLVRYEHLGAENVAVFLVFALLITAPVLLILGPLFAVYVFLSRCNTGSLLGTFICIISAGCLIAEYFWLGYVFRD